MNSPKFFLYIPFVFFIFSCSQVPKPKINNDPARSSIIEDQGRSMMTKIDPNSSVLKIKLPASSFILRGPNMPTNDKHIKVSFVEQRFDDIVLALAKDCGVNILLDARVTKPEDVKDINQQIQQINQAIKQTGTQGQPPFNAPNMVTSGQATPQISLPPAQVLQQPLLQPIQNIQTRKPEQDISQNLSSGKEGTKFHREDRETFDRVTINFDGTISNLFKRLSEISGLFFNEQHGTITVRKIETFSVTLPNYPQLLETITTNITALGGEDVAFDQISSSLSFKSNYRGFVRIKEYLEKIRDNAALVTLRIILLSVNLKDNHNFGIDWSQFAIGSGWNNTSQVLSGSTSNLYPNLADGVTSAIGAASSASGGINLLFQANNFNLTGFVGILDNYGSTSIVQNAFVECMSGTSAKFRAITKTKYVSNLGIAALNNNSASTVGSTQTETVEYGAEISIKPLYNSVDKSLVIDMDCKISELIGFNSYNSGTYGTLQLPETAEKDIKNVLRLAHNQIAVIGGLIYIKKKNDSTGIPGTNLFISRNNQQKDEQNELVMIVKPTVLEFEL